MFLLTIPGNKVTALLDFKMISGTAVQLSVSG
jgi:hypothetical protein